MRFPLLLSVAMTVLALAPLHAEPAAAPPTIDTLVTQLGSPDSKTRDAASKALAAMGHEVLPALRKLRNQPDRESRRRLDILIDVLESQAKIAPKRLTMKLNDKSLAEVIGEVNKQTGYQFEITGEADDRDKRLYDLDMANVPFWEAMDKICLDGGLVLQPWHGTEGNLMIRAQNAVSPFVHNEGAFRVEAQGLSYSRNVTFGPVARDGFAEGARSESMNLSLSVTVEPRLRLLGLGHVRLTEASDERGNSLLHANSPGDNIRGLYRSWDSKSLNLSAYTPLTYACREARRVKRIRGVVPVRVLLEERADIVVDKPLTVKNKTYTAGTTELTVEEVTHNKEGGRNVVKLKFTLKTTDKSGTANLRSSLEQRLQLEDAKGNKFRSWGSSLSGGEENVSGTFEFINFNGGEEAPMKLVYTSWVTLEHHVNFEFKDLPLP